MVRIEFVTAGGESVTIVARPEASLMEAAVNHAVAGIEAQCYGAGVCGTCHLYVGEANAALLEDISAWERDMLACIPLATSRSRLSCQIKVTPDLDRACFHLPERQDAV